MNKVDGVYDIIRTDGSFGDVPVIKNAEMSRGDDETLEVTVRDNAGAVVDISTATPIVCTVRQTTESKELIKKTLAASQIAITDGPNGVLEVTFLPADTQDLLPGDYVYDVELTLSSKKKTVVQGNLVIVADVSY